MACNQNTYIASPHIHKGVTEYFSRRLPNRMEYDSNSSFNLEY